MRAKLEFKFSPWTLLAALIAIALTLALGNWQLRRGDEKVELAARADKRAREPAIQVSTRELAASEVEWRRVEARGTFEPQHAVLLDNRVHHGTVGYQVVMPLRLGDGSRYVLVDRGWTAGSRDRTRMPEVKTPRETVTVRGRAIVPSVRFLELSKNVAEGPVWQNLTIDRYREAKGIPIQPFVIEQDPEDALADGLVRKWEAPDFGADKHYGYAFQWFALSALILVFYLVTHVRRKRAT